MDPVLAIILIIAALLIGAAIVYFLMVFVFNNKVKSAEKSSKQIVRDAEVKAERITKNAEIDAKQTVFEMKQQAQNEIRQMKQEVQLQQNKLDAREDAIDARDKAILQKETALDRKNDILTQKIEANDKKSEELEKKIDAIITELEKVSGMSVKEAHDEIMKRVENKMSVEIAAYIKNAEDEAKDTAEAKAKDLLALACDKYAQDVITEHSVAVIALPTDELKGRIIGREGRNIRVLESTLGVDLVIDDTPEVITISCFNPIRREIARRTLEALVKDGRIQPGRIEEMANKFKEEVENDCQKAGIDAANKLGLPRINRELLAILGKLKYRTSYGQNVLQHSIEVGYLTGIMAAELGLDQNLARRAGLLHDIGKAVDFEQDGSHASLGAELARKFGEPDIVVNSIEGHHGDVALKSVIAHLVVAGDTLSAARPGSRSETLESYTKRITQLEEIAKSYEGVQAAYAMQAGREIRVMVVPERVSDADAVRMAQQMREQIETTMTYPGQIKVSVIREYRANELAK